ncbi:hypothetical protein C0995_006619 [Termitomyces sp. Mi166|nr:hypothetical protein C0995_006619 [Termitomyces sp. Mi166\
MSARKSGLQKEVLALYRRFEAFILSSNRALRMVHSKPESTRPKFLLFVRYTFRANASNISPRNVSAIEHVLRKGARQIAMYENTAVKDCWVSDEMLAWEKGWKTGPVQNTP